MSNLLYLNSLFDSQLAGTTVSRLHNFSSELTTLFLPVADVNDTVIIDISIPDEYILFLEKYDLCRGICTRVTDNKFSKTTAMPWGWNKFSLSMFQKLCSEIKAPSIDIVKKVNSRKFHYNLSKSCSFGKPKMIRIETLDDYCISLKSYGDNSFVIKPDYGNAGSGFILSDDIKRGKNAPELLERLFKHNIGCILEPWFRKKDDISSRFIISKNGDIHSLRHHRALANKAGTFFADWFIPNDPVITKYRCQLDEAVYEMANGLIRAGYYGVVGTDSITYWDKNDKESITVGIEINARHPMSTVAYSCYDRLAANKCATFRFISKKKHRLPESYDALSNILGDLFYSQDTMLGIIPITPLRVNHGNGWVQPLQSVFLISANSEDLLLQTDLYLRKILQR